VLTRARLALVAVGLVVGLSACSSSQATTPSSTASSPSGAIGSIPLADRSPAGTPSSQPSVVVPSSMPPTQLEVADLIPGTGPKAVAGDTVSVQYVLATYSSKGVVQSSWTSQPFSFQLGAGQVIRGWDLGLVGLQAGGRRELIIPASYGYGAQSPGPGIAADDTLVFVVDCLSVTPPKG
jgi:peptidylprolyl isomerase